MYIQEPEDLLKNFIRSKVAELTRSTPSLANRQTTDSQSFSGNDSTTIFTLTTSPVAINSITIDGTEVYPYLDFNIDLANKKIKFRTAPAAGTNNVVVSFEKGNNWVYPYMSRTDLNKSAYPRISIFPITESSDFKELGSTDTIDIVPIQFDILSYRNLICTISGEAKEGMDIVNYLARELINAIKTHWKDYLSYRIRGFDIVGNAPAPFEPNPNLFRRIVTINFTIINSEEAI